MQMSGRLTLVSLLMCQFAMAQTNAGRISGAVLDPSGAPVPGCLVTATNTHTGLKKAMLTETSGFYAIPALPPGAYVLTAEKDGFRVGEQSGVVLDAASQRTIDFHLEVGVVSQSVKVTAAAERTSPEKSST